MSRRTRVIALPSGDREFDYYVRGLVSRRALRTPGSLLVALQPRYPDATVRSHRWTAEPETWFVLRDGRRVGPGGIGRPAA